MILNLSVITYLDEAGGELKSLVSAVQVQSGFRKGWRLEIAKTLTTPSWKMQVMFPFWVAFKQMAPQFFIDNSDRKNFIFGENNIFIVQ
jgi:hypothetical protein